MIMYHGRFLLLVLLVLESIIVVLDKIFIYNCLL